MSTCRQILSLVSLLLAAAGCASGRFIPYDGHPPGERAPPASALQASSRMEPRGGHATTRRIVDFLERRLLEPPEQQPLVTAAAGSN